MVKKKKTKKTVKAKKTVKPRKVKKPAKAKAKRKSGLTQQTYVLSPELASVVGTTKSTRPQIVKKLWAYIKAHKCQDLKNRRLIIADEKLSVIIGKKPVEMLKLAGFLNKHIQK